MTQPTPQEQPQATASRQRHLTLGIPAPVRDRRLPLTPEAAAIIGEYGIEVRIQQGAGAFVNYPDNRYAAAGARLTDRAGALDCDIVVSVEAPSADDAARMRRGATLLTLEAQVDNTAALKALLERRICAISMRQIQDTQTRHPFSDILGEIAGRAAVTMAVARLAEVDADINAGKGILIGGIAGIVPCEVVVIGSGIAARAAASAALGLGGTVRLFDDDTYGLRTAMDACGGRLICSAMQPHVLQGAIAMADVIILTPTAMSYMISAASMSAAKRGVLVYDLTDFDICPLATMDSVDLAATKTRHNHSHGIVCFRNLSAAVPRTTAMALSNALVSLLPDLVDTRGVNSIASLRNGIQRAVYTCMGHITDADLARSMSGKYIDIALLGRLS